MTLLPMSPEVDARENAAGDERRGRSLTISAACEACVLLAEGLLPSRRRLRDVGAAQLNEFFQQAQEWLFHLLVLACAEGRGLPLFTSAGRSPFATVRRGADESIRTGDARHPSLGERVRRSLAPLKSLMSAPAGKSSDAALEQALERLSRVDARPSMNPQLVDFSMVPARFLGELYEVLLESRLQLDGTALILSTDRSRRKARGAFYTPEPIVQFIIEQSLAPVLEAKWADAALRQSPAADVDRLLERALDFRVLDPAMGSGHFLVAALHFLTGRVEALLHEMGIAVERSSIRRRVLSRCLYGADCDPMAVRLARASLWLEAGGEADGLERRLRCGDSLLGNGGPPEDDEQGAAKDGARGLEWSVIRPETSGGFDAVIGNPPYAGHRGSEGWRRLAEVYEVCRRRPNPATAFLERGMQLLRAGGRIGMVVPKSIQYVESWQPARDLLSQSNRLLHVADVSQAFDKVLLEQTVCIAAREPARGGYTAWTPSRNQTFSRRRIGGDAARELGCLPANVDARSLPLWRRLAESGPRLGEISTTSQALGCQKRLNRVVSGELLPIRRGKQVRPLTLDEPADFIDRAFLTARGSHDLTAKCQALLQPKVVSQNIVAHVTRPRPRVWIISAADHAGGLCLNTISATLLHDDRFSIDYVAAVLNSTLASWFYTELVFCRAVRTMHFDDWYAGKLPIAEIDARTNRRFEELPGRIRPEMSRGARQRLIDDAVFEAYGLDDAARSFLYEYCYGASEPRAE